MLISFEISVSYAYYIIILCVKSSFINRKAVQNLLSYFVRLNFSFIKRDYGTNRHREYLNLQFVNFSINYIRDNKLILRKNERSKAERDAGASLLFPPRCKLVNESSAYL